MSKYKIKLNGLKDGSYINSFRIRGEFFETLNSSEIKLVLGYQTFQFFVAKLK